MKLLILSDSHSTLSFMRRCIDSVKPDGMIHLGDHFDDAEAIREEYARHSCTIGSEVRVVGTVNLTGRAEGIEESGALLVRTPDGELHRVLAGDVSVRGVMGYV